MEEYLSNHGNPLINYEFDQKMVCLLIIVYIEIMFIVCILSDTCYTKRNKDK